MKMVVDIDENLYRAVKNPNVDSGYCANECYNVIQHGIPLPKGYGDLIDRKELLKQPMDKANYPSNYVKIAPTIIEADKAESEG